MKIEIWSDIMCPFCYIGKRKFEKALTQFSKKEKIEVEWKSFQLNPDIKTDPNVNTTEWLSRHLGINAQQASMMNQQVTERAQLDGLTYNMDKTVLANTFNAHRFIHFAKKYGKQDEAEEVLFRSYFTDGENIDDFSLLITLGKEIGLNELLLKQALENNLFSDEVKFDINEANHLGVRGVPFFVFNRKYAISGAQDSDHILTTIEKSFEEWEKDNSAIKLTITEGESCNTKGECN